MNRLKQQLNRIKVMDKKIGLLSNKADLAVLLAQATDDDSFVSELQAALSRQRLGIESPVIVDEDARRVGERLIQNIIRKLEGGAA